ncbi:MAG: FAD-dependent oxidoreductase [Nannocystaceae bacterium]
MEGAKFDPGEPADVLILGASFTGIELLYQLRRTRGGERLKVVVVDRQAEHGYIPLVHERLVGRVGEREATLKTAECVERDPLARFVEAEITGLDPERRAVSLADGRTLSARFVVVCLGSTIDPPPAIPGRERLHAIKLAAPYADARRDLEALLRAPEGAAPPTVTVIGGGITGVEMAGELVHLAKARPAGWRAPKVTLVHGGARLLPGFRPRIGRRAARHLEAQGVTLLLQHRLGAAHEGHLEVVSAEGTSRQVPSDMTFWAGGVRPAPILERLGLPRTDAGWLAVGPTLQCFPSAAPSRPELFAGGDAVRVQGGDGEWPTMQRAIECLWQAKVLARSLVALAGEPADYPRGVPPLTPHTLTRDFFHGISLGGASLVVYGRLMIDWSALNTWFRRFLMRHYFLRYGQR